MTGKITITLPPVERAQFTAELVRQGMASRVDEHGGSQYTCHITGY